MLGAGRYLLGVVEIGALAGFAGLGAARLRSRILPSLSGPPAWLASGVLALALLIWVAVILGSFGAFKALPYILAVAFAGLSLRLAVKVPAVSPAPSTSAGRWDGSDPRPSPSTLLTLIGLFFAGLALIHFGAGVRLRLSTGMTGFDSTWYHGPLAVSIFQSGNTFALHFLAPQYLAWFYPDNAELFHAIGMAAFDRDILSPLLNLGWLLGCLLALWCIGRPFGVAPVSLALGAIVLSVPALADQAGEARNDIAALFFLLAAVAIALNLWPSRSKLGFSSGAIAVIGLAGGLAAGTKLLYLPAAVVLVAGLAQIAPKGGRWRALTSASLGALAGGGYWYLRNVVQAGNPLPWVRHLGPISLPGPQQPLGGREGHSVLDYLGNRSVWSHWFLPGLDHGLWVLWPLLGGLALGGLALSLGRRANPVMRLCALLGLVVAITWALVPSSAEGRQGAPRGFESALRYLTPTLVLGITLLVITPPLRQWIRRRGSLGSSPRNWGRAARWARLALCLLILAAVALGYQEQRSYLRRRYSDPTFTTHSLDAVFRWARSISGARIATTTTREYPLYGTDLSNRVQFVGIERPNGGFVAPGSCQTWRRALDAGHYDYVVTALDRVQPGGPRLPPAAGWTVAPSATAVLREPTAIVFRLSGPLSPASCPS